MAPESRPVADSGWPAMRSAGPMSTRSRVTSRSTGSRRCFISACTGTSYFAETRPAGALAAKVPVARSRT